MPLQLASPPANAYQLIAQAISRLSTVGGSVERVTSVNDPSKLSAALPHMVYVMRNDAIAQGQNVDNARLVAWRFLIQYGTQTLGAIEFSCDSRGQNLRFASLDTGPFAQGTRDAVTIAEGLSSVRAGSYELRALKAPSVYAMALWLKNLQGRDDIVIPITPAGPGPQAASKGGAPLPQDPREFLGGIQADAAAAQQFDSMPSSGGKGGPDRRLPRAPTLSDPLSPRT
jgi:hypothetical protein